MNQRLKDYLQKCTPATVDKKALNKLYHEMEKAVPEIAKRIQEREERAAELRIAVAKPSQSEKGRED